MESPGLAKEPLRPASAKSPVPFERPISTSPAPPEYPHYNYSPPQRQGKASIKEWVPHMLRKTRGLPLVVGCWCWVALLEVFNFNVRRHQGIPAVNASTVGAARYVPTVGVVVLSFFWKALVGDLKKIVPWSKMSGRWTTAKHSLLLDYVNDIELFSLAVALKRRHWSIVLGLFSTFLFGTLVALANSLTYVELFAQVATDISLKQQTLFQLEEALIYPNRSLRTQFNVNGTKPYAIVSTLRLPNGYPAPWTSDTYAFESFNTSQRVTNATISATVQAFSSRLECKPLRYTWSRPAPRASQIIANADDVAAAGCQLPIRQEFDSSIMVHSHMRPRGWLNLTSCSRTDASDVRILGTISITTDMVPTEITNATAFGVICTPRFQTQPALVAVNASSGHVVSFKLDAGSPAKDVDIKTPTEALWVYLNDPLNAQMQASFAGNATGTATTEGKKPNANLSDILAAVSRYEPRFGVDPFFTLLMDGHIELAADEYEHNLEDFREDVEVLANSLLVQVMNGLARKEVPAVTMLEGKQIMMGPRLFLRQIPLRVLQGILFLIGFSGIFHVTMMRPKTILREDPGSIASTAVVLASSNEETERVLSRHATANEHDFHKELRKMKCSLRVDPQTDRVALEVVDPTTPGHTPAQTPALGSVMGSSATHRYSSLYEAPAITKISGHGWAPLPLRFSSKILIVVGFIAVMGILGVLQHQSATRGGLIKNESLAPLMLSFGTTSLLVLLGYTASGVDGSVREMAPYRSLFHATPRKPLLSNPREMPILWIPFQATARQSGFAMLASSSVILAFPIVKTVAAGLYTAALHSFSQPITATVDGSLVQSLEDTYFDVNPDTVRQRASQFCEWTQVPTLNVPTRAGILENLVFSNITVDDKGMDGANRMGTAITVKVPAVAVEVNCTVLEPSDFNVEATAASNGSISLGFVCGNQKCRDVLGTDRYPYLRNGVPGQFLGSGSLLDRRAGNGSLEIFFTDAPYLITIADFTAITTPIRNNTPISSNGTIVTKDMLNVTLPTARVASCRRALSEVDVVTTFTQMALAGLDNKLRFLPWSPSSYDRNSVEFRRRYNTSLPDFFAPESLLRSAGTAERDGYLAGPTLYPTRASSRNIFEVLADRANFQDRNVTGLLDPKTLGRTAEIMYTKYCAEILTELRPYAVNESNSRPTTDTYKSVTGTVAIPQSRLFMSLTATIVLEALLAACLLCLLWVFVRYPHRPIVPRPPQSIASRMAFLAHSQLIRRLRGEPNLTDRHQTRLFHEVAGLGWWRLKDAEGNRFGWRWGIDLGKADEKRWDRAPFAGPGAGGGGRDSGGSRGGIGIGRGWWGMGAAVRESHDGRRSGVGEGERDADAASTFGYAPSHGHGHQEHEEYLDHDVYIGARGAGTGLGHQRSRSDIELSMLSPPAYQARFHEDASLLRNAG